MASGSLWRRSWDKRLLVSKYIVAILLFVSRVCCAADPAAPAGVTVSLDALSGVLLGTANEYVWDQANQKPYLLSELDWGMLPAFYLGVAAEISIPAGFVASASFKAGLPGLVGVITDSDFLNYDGVKTNFSQHDCYLERAILVDTAIGWRFSLGPTTGQALMLSLYGEFGLMLFAWSARNGYLQYPPEGSRPYTPWFASESEIPVSGIGILYEQDYLIPALGAEVKWPALPELTLSGSFSVSPISWCFDVDAHILRLTEFYDSTAGGWFFQPGVKAEYLVGRARVALEVSYRILFGLVGDSYSTSIGIGTGAPSATTPNGGGAGFGVLDAGLSFRLAL